MYLYDILFIEVNNPFHKIQTLWEVWYSILQSGVELLEMPDDDVIMGLVPFLQPFIKLTAGFKNTVDVCHIKLEQKPN